MGAAMNAKAVLFQLVLLFAILTVYVSARSSPGWPEWEDFVTGFIHPNGRVIDVTFERKSTSEGQSYGLFFALVANQRSRFDSILKWTSDHLAAGQLGDKLPAWLWGLRNDGSWGVKDENSASDSDLWIAYTLLEAGRLWNAPGYAETGRKLLARIRRDEVAEAGKAGPVLLPGAYGFTLDNGRFRLNPSYLPGFMFRYLASADPKGPWQAIWDGYLRMAPQVFRAGVAPDLFVVDSNGQVTPDTESEPSGSYDAIRVYLWAGMSGDDGREMIKRFSTYSALIRKYGAPPEKVDPLSGKATKSDYSPIGFSGAVLPFLSAAGETAVLERQHARIRAKQTGPPNYYDQVLILFGKGWLDGHYRFDSQGRLQPKWTMH